MKKKILIIEDNRDRQEEWKELLTDYPVKIIQAFSIEEAEKEFNKNLDLDAIVVDACVPGSDPNTIRIVESFRISFRHPMVAVSNRNDFNDMLISAGCDHKSEKHKLVEKIKQIFDL